MFEAETMENTELVPVSREFIFASDEDDDCEPTWDFSVEEDVLIFASIESGSLEIEVLMVGESNPPGTPLGMASHDDQIGGFLDDQLGESLGVEDFKFPIDVATHKPMTAGYFVVEDCTGDFSPGDGWEIEATHDLYPGPVRPATFEEILAGEIGRSFWNSIDR